MTPVPDRLWRVFPWDPEAAPGEPFSSSYLPPIQGKGRFDLPGVPAGVLYLAESPEHAVGEAIQHYRGHDLREADLLVVGRALALVRVSVPPNVLARTVDLCDPEVLVREGLRPDRLAARDRTSTQRIAADLHRAGHAGLRWWSALAGDWHTIVLFRDRLAEWPVHDAPERLTVDHPAVGEAAHALGISISRR